MNPRGSGCAFAPGYMCLLDEQPHYLVPARRLLAEDRGPLVVNPQCWFTWRGEPPARLAVRVGDVSGFVPAACVAWVPDAATGALWPYWIGHAVLPHLAPLAPGDPVPDHLPAAWRWVLTRAGVFVAMPSIERVGWQREQRERHLRRLQAQFGHGFVPLAELIPPFQLGSLRRHYRHCVRIGAMTLGDGQVPHRYVWHNEPIARFVAAQLVEAISALAQRRLKPSYAYVAAYQGGAVLARHTDREQCEYTVSVCIDASPEPDSHCAWPIKLDTPTCSVGIVQALGDGLLFRGRRIAHHRDRLPLHCSVTSMLLHFVDAGYSGRLE